MIQIAITYLYSSMEEVNNPGMSREGRLVGTRVGTDRKCRNYVR